MAYLQRLRETFWLAPGVLCVVAAVAAQTLIAVDGYLQDGSGDGIDRAFVYEVGAAGSRDLLGAIAGSMLAVASTTFSITIAVLALTSSSYGPRLVRNFMADRGNQLVLGTYVATYLYTLLVLRSIRTLEGDDEEFVPHLAVNGAVLLAIASIGVLVWFIHHIADSIQVWTLARRVHGELRAVVDDLYPEGVGESPDEPSDALVAAALASPVRSVVRASTGGYVLRVDADGLVELAEKRGMVVQLVVRPGSYVVERGELARVRGTVDDPDEVEAAVRRCLPIASSRSPYQDVEFAAQQLVEMAVRALSPSTNDPYTAMNALDELSDALAAMSRRPVPSPARSGPGGAVRVLAPGVQLSDLVTMLVDAVRAYGCDHPDVVRRTVTVLDRVGREADAAARRQLVTELDRLRDHFAATGPNAHDLRRLDEQAQATRSRLAGV